MTTCHRSGTHTLLGAYHATPLGKRSLVALTVLIVAVTLVCGLGVVGTSVAAAAVPTYAWATQGGGLGSDYARGVSALADGSSIITGSFRGTAIFGDTTLTSNAGSRDTFTAKVKADGTYAWATKGGGKNMDVARSVSALPDGSSIITGRFRGIATFGTTAPLTSAGGDDSFTAKLNADGSYVWATKGGGLGSDYASGVSALLDGSSIITGHFSGTAIFGSTILTSTAGSDDSFTAKLNADGSYAWATQGGGLGSDYARGVSALADGSSIITGIFNATAAFGSTTLTSAGSYDSFTAKVNADGTYAWATRGGGPYYDYASGVSALPDGSSIITGYFDGIATFGTTTLTSSYGSADMFTAKLNADGSFAWATQGGGGGVMTPQVVFRHFWMVQASSPDTSMALRSSDPRPSQAPLGYTTRSLRNSTLMVLSPGPFEVGARVMTTHMAFRHSRMVRASSPDVSVVLRSSEPRPPSQALGHTTPSQPAS